MDILRAACIKVRRGKVWEMMSDIDEVACIWVYSVKFEQSTNPRCTVDPAEDVQSCNHLRTEGRYAKG